MTKQADADIKHILTDINSGEAKGVMRFGLAAQTQMADFSASLLGQMRSIKTGDIEFPLYALMDNVQAVDIGGLSEKMSEKRFNRKADKLLKAFNKADSDIFALEMQLDTARGDLLRDVVKLEKLKGINKTHTAGLENYIKAGSDALKKLDSDQKKRTQDKQNAITRLQKRVHDLKLSRMVSLQMAPQIDLIVSTNKTLIEKIQTALDGTIPLWRNQMALMHTLIKQKTAQQMQMAVAGNANAVLAKNAQELKQAVEQGQNPLDVLKKTSQDLTTMLADIEAVYTKTEAHMNVALTEASKLKTKIIEQ